MILGVSVMTARRWWRRLSESAIDRRTRQDLSTSRMIELRAEGLSFYQISKKLECTQSAVKWRLFRAGAVGFEPTTNEGGRERFRLARSA